MYACLAAVRGEYNSKPMPYCRTDGSLSEVGKPTAHIQLLHQFSDIQLLHQANDHCVWSEGTEVDCY